MDAIGLRYLLHPHAIPGGCCDSRLVLQHHCRKSFLVVPILDLTYPSGLSCTDMFGVCKTAINVRYATGIHSTLGTLLLSCQDRLPCRIR